MRKEFKNSAGGHIVFTDDTLAFLGPREDVFYPYSSLDALRFSILGDLEAIGGVSICCFEAEQEDRAEIRKLVQFARKAKSTLPPEEKLVVNLRKRKKENWIPEGLTEEEQLRCYKNLFVQGSITREEYAFRKKLLQPQKD